ncbi:MAG: hypothetical protein WCG50_18590 [Rhodoferax sp.]|uniref:hypothetical protein n=1 Tax=Rhodoferax sp. TaxID=50421 RepID=UPI003016BEF8
MWLARGSVIAGEDLFTSVLRMWLGEKPVDGNQKKSLIGSRASALLHGALGRRQSFSAIKHVCV